MKNVQSSHDKENQFSVMKISTSEPIIANDTATTSTNATTGNNFSCLNQTIIDIENILYKNCIELSQHETKLITLLERSEAMEKNAKQFKKVNKKFNLLKWKQHKFMTSLIVIGAAILIMIIILLLIYI
ncbi:unnamed protein product [Schistosoma intercalatum]|nr:unnamed protein product [Schistosoma intercalatum]CAH8618772.1 unnamed protein product [Schistosoma intercalatum]